MIQNNGIQSDGLNKVDFFVVNENCKKQSPGLSLQLSSWFASFLCPSALPSAPPFHTQLY